ncbi:F-box protein CPR1 [Linum perenne]
MSDQISQEVMVSILLRLKVKDLVHCRRVSKYWLSIIDDPQFISLQLERSVSTNSNAALFLQDRDSPILYCKQNYASDINFFSTPIHYEPSQVLLMGSCHGLVCFSLWDNPRDFFVLNPSTGERHTVSSPIKVERKGGILNAYGFGYDKLSDDYKVVRIIQTITDSFEVSYRAEINGVRSKGFSVTVPLPNADMIDYKHKYTGVFVGGSIHWCIRNCSKRYPYPHVIHAIDLASNTYCQLQCPDYNFCQTGFVNFYIGTVDTRLSLSGILMNISKIGIWVMEEYGNPESWNRLYCIDYEGPTSYSVSSMGSNGDKILLMLNWQKFGWCDPIKDADDNAAILTDYGDFGCDSYEALYCSESLVRIFPNGAAAAAAADHVKKDAYDEHLKKLTIEEFTQKRQPAGFNFEAVLKRCFDEMRNEN